VVTRGAKAERGAAGVGVVAPNAAGDDWAM
jgi:hypothetical protein